jgi:hypothetical protein
VTFKKLLLYFVPFLPSMIFGFLGNNVAMGTTAGIGLAILFMINIDKLEYFRGLGIETKMKNLDNLIEEGNETIEKLKEVAVGISEPIIDQLAFHGLTVIEIPNLSYVAEQYEKVVSILSNLDIEKSKIDSVSELYFQVFQTKILNAAKSKMLDNIDQYDENISNELRSLEIKNTDDQSRKKFIEILDNLPKIDNEASEIINQYRDFVLTGKIKNKEIIDN